MFIDDLDRCLPEQAARLLESIKLVLHQRGFAFILGIYSEIIEEFIRNKYAKDYHFTTSGDEAADKRKNDYLKYFDQYLNKIIQVHHHVSKRETDGLEKYIEELIKSWHEK